MLQGYYKPRVRRGKILQDAIESERRIGGGKKRAGCRDCPGEVVLQRYDTDSIAPKGDGGKRDTCP